LQNGTSARWPRTELGRDATLDVVGDPKVLLRTFNAASASYRFSESLAVAVADIGSAP
jgi:hypothetical protein